MVGNVGFGLSGVVKGYLGKTDNLKLGVFEFPSISTSFQDFEVLNNYSKQVLRNGILGNILLSRFNVIIDYSREKLYLKPNRSYNKEFEYDKSGLTIFAVGQDLNQYYVSAVITDSPAYNADIRPGDLIIKVGMRRTKTLKLQDLTHKLSQKVGKKIKMTILRNDQKLKKEFRLDEWWSQGWRGYSYTLNRLSLIDN